jgi:hypothetical protein
MYLHNGTYIRLATLLPSPRFLTSFEEVREAYIQELRELPAEIADARRAWNTELSEEKSRRVNSRRRAARSRESGVAASEVTRDSGLQDVSSVAGDDSEDGISTANEAAEGGAEGNALPTDEYVDVDGRSLRRTSTVYRREPAAQAEDGSEPSVLETSDVPRLVGQSPLSSVVSVEGETSEA